MRNYADTGFLASLYLVQSTSAAALAAISQIAEPLPIVPLVTFELRNTFNLAIARGHITEAQRDVIWAHFQAHVAGGVYVEKAIPLMEWHKKAHELSDRYTPAFATRSLDLLHVAAAVCLKAKVFLSFDERQRKAATGEGMKVKP